MIGLSVFPSQKPFYDALFEAARQETDVLLISNRIVMLSQTGSDILSGIGLVRLIMGSSDSAPRINTTDPLPILRTVAAAARPSLVALLFSHSPLSIAHRVILPYSSSTAVNGQGGGGVSDSPAVKFAQLISPSEVEVHVVRIDSEPIAVATGGLASVTEKETTAASGVGGASGGGNGGVSTPGRGAGTTPILGALSSPSPALNATPAFRVSSTASVREMSAVPPLASRPNTRHFSARGKDMTTTMERVLRAHAGVYRYAILNGDVGGSEGSYSGGVGGPESPRRASMFLPISSSVVTVPEDKSVHGGVESVVSSGGGGSSDGSPQFGSSSLGLARSRSRTGSGDFTQEAHFTRLAETIAVCAAAHTSCLVIFSPNQNKAGNRIARLDSI